MLKPVCLVLTPVNTRQKKSCHYIGKGGHWFARLSILFFFPPFLKKEKALGRLSHVPERKTAKHVRFGASKRFKGII